MLISTYKNQFDTSINTQTNNLNSLNLLRFNDFKRANGTGGSDVAPQHLQTMATGTTTQNNYGQQQYIYAQQKRNTVTEHTHNQYRQQLSQHNYLQQKKTKEAVKSVQDSNSGRGVGKNFSGFNDETLSEKIKVENHKAETKSPEPKKHPLSSLIDDKGTKEQNLASQHSDSPCKECSESSDDLDEEDLEYGSEQEFGDDDEEKDKQPKSVFKWKFTRLDPNNTGRSKSA